MDIYKISLFFVGVEIIIFTVFQKEWSRFLFKNENKKVALSMKDFFHQKKNLSLLKKYETENSNPLYLLAYCILKTVYRRTYNFCCVNKIFFMFTITLLSSKVGLPGKGTKKRSTCGQDSHYYAEDFLSKKKKTLRTHKRSFF